MYFHAFGMVAYPHELSQFVLHLFGEFGFHYFPFLNVIHVQWFCRG